MLASVAIAPNWVTVLGSAGATGIVQKIAKRWAVINGIFDVARGALWVALAIVVYNAFRGEYLLSAPRSYVPAFVPIILVFGLLNSGAVAGAIAITQNTEFLEYVVAVSSRQRSL